MPPACATYTALASTAPNQNGIQCGLAESNAELNICRTFSYTSALLDRACHGDLVGAATAYSQSATPCCALYMA